MLGLVTEDGHGTGDTSIRVPQRRRADVELYLAPIEGARAEVHCFRPTQHLTTQGARQRSLVQPERATVLITRRKERHALRQRQFSEVWGRGICTLQALLRSVLPYHLPLSVKDGHPIGHCLEYRSQLGSLLFGFRTRLFSLALQPLALGDVLVQSDRTDNITGLV